MQTVRVKKAELMEKLQRNRANHRNLFEAAWEAYRGEVVRRLDLMLADARAGRRFVTTVALRPPIDQTKEYDRAITQLQMEVRDQVELTDHDFAQYVMDDWNWKSQVTALNFAYVDPGEAVADQNGLFRGEGDQPLCLTSYKPKKDLSNLSFG